MSGYVQYSTEIGEDTGKAADMATPGCPLEVSETGIVTKINYGSSQALAPPKNGSGDWKSLSDIAEFYRRSTAQ